jgi:dienelactone hydrolase
MTTVLLFHHAHGQTSGFLAFADELREADHTVHAPDLYDGNTFRDLVEGVAYAERVGFPEIIRRGSAVAMDLPTDIVYAGFSLGALPAQSLAQTRPGARGAIFFHACVPTSEFESPWPGSVPLQIHMMDRDPWAEDDLPVAEALVEEVEDAELFLYPGSGHLFADPSLNDYEEQAAGLLKQRTFTFLHRVGSSDPAHDSRGD